MNLYVNIFYSYKRSLVFFRVSGILNGIWRKATWRKSWMQA